MRSIPGWCSEDKSILMMNVIKENQCKNCIEIGVFAGKSLFPIAKALEYNRTGIIFAIDAWNPVEATKGYNLSDPNYNCNGVNLSLNKTSGIHEISLVCEDFPLNMSDLDAA